ncbi:MAG: dihydrofolate reductase [bacterium]
MNAIVAIYDHWGIGKDGTQPVVVPEDRRHFRQITGRGTLVVGRRTLADFPGGQPLKGRRNIVLSRRPGYSCPGAEVARSVEELKGLLREGEETFVIGGASIYRLLLPLVERVYVTRLSITPECDVWFPNLDERGWRITEESPLYTHEGIPYQFLTYER